MAVNTKNLGQVAGVAIQTTPPSNITLIWYDSTPSQMCHKIYDTAKKQWVIIDQKIVSLITYSEIENIARQSGLPLGKFYQITDRNNALAVAITSTKVQYCDALGNILIDDLGTNIQYHVSSSNLQIDDISGTFSNTGNKLVFLFEELENDIDNDYIFGKTKRENVWKLFKFKLNALVSSETGNSITWNKGLFLNISQIINNLKDKIGGFVSTEKFNETINLQNTAINNVGKENQQIIQNAQNALNKATTAESIYGKKLPSVVATSGNAIDIAKGDELHTIISKIQRYINRFKYATGINLSNNYSSTSKGKVNNNDTVETAISKLQNQLSNLRQSLPSDWAPNTQIHSNIEAGDTYDDAFGKIEADRRVINSLEQSQNTVEFYDGNNAVVDLLSYRITNGMLEIIIPKFEKIEWLYTRIVVYDYTRFFAFNFSDEIFNKIKPYLFIPEEQDFSIFNAYRITPLATISLAKHYGDSTWEAPNYDIKSLVSLAYAKWRISTDDGYVDKEGIGISLTPLSKISMSDGNLQVQEINNSSTFQGLVKSTNVRYYIPPMLIRFKLH